MARHLVTYEQAFAQLADASQNPDRKVRDIAADVAMTGELARRTDRRRPGPSAAAVTAAGWGVS